MLTNIVVYYVCVFVLCVIMYVGYGCIICLLNENQKDSDQRLQTFRRLVTLSDNTLALLS